MQNEKCILQVPSQDSDYGLAESKIFFWPWKKALRTGLKWKHHSLLKLRLLWCHQAVRPAGPCWVSMEVTRDVGIHCTTPSCTPPLVWKIRDFKNLHRFFCQTLLGSQYVHWFLVSLLFLGEKEKMGGKKHDPIQSNVKIKSALVITSGN